METMKNTHATDIHSVYDLDLTDRSRDRNTMTVKVYTCATTLGKMLAMARHTLEVQELIRPEKYLNQTAD